MSDILDSIGVNLAKRFMATQFPVWGADGSKWMDRYETSKFPDLSIIPQLGGAFMGWKASQGAGDFGFVDRTFKEAWKQMRVFNETHPEQMIARKAFHFWDYAPAHYTGSAELFGAAQARFFRQTIKDDPGEMPPALDAESFVAWFNINWLNQSKPMSIAGGFRKQFSDDWGYESELYTNPGMLPYYGDQFKSMNLWLSWYNQLKTYTDLQALLKKYNWRGKLLFWQYASDGDLDEDGNGDGLKLGMEEKNLDLNVFLGTMAEFSAYCGQKQSPVS
ncbi:MAG: GH25 family lysozyme, partial [Anaerolineaceae bacterium]